jgi:predicted Rossmann-fold nucleotide-binding protein
MQSGIEKDVSPMSEMRDQTRKDEAHPPGQKILVAGSRRIQTNYGEITQLARAIGAKVMHVDNWILLNGGASEESSKGNRSVDYLVCIGAQEALKESGDQKLEEDKILTLLPKDADQTLFHKIGKVKTVKGDLKSRRKELVKQADAIITIEGNKGTDHIIKIGRNSYKPVLPIACTGGKSKEAWDDYEEDILQKFRIKKPSEEYEILTTNRGLAKTEELSKLVIDRVKDRLIEDKLYRPVRSTPAHTDDPSKKDLLGRRPYAKVIASGIDYYLHKSENGKAPCFLVHLYGPWGSGKSTLLGFLREELGSEWIVVEFNAWQHQRIGQPWWSLMDTVYKTILQETQKTSPWLSDKIRIKENMWRLGNGWSRTFWFATFSSAAIAIAVFAAILVGYIPIKTPEGTADPNGVLTIFSGIIATIASIVTGIRAIGNSLVPGSADAASQFVMKTADPMEKLKQHFLKIMSWSGENKHVVIFVDDLDRCRVEYTVKFLEGIQTIFRAANNLVFVIAADRRWLFSSYQNDYGSFSEALEDLGRPLGYLFLDKTFQISVPMPKLSGHYQENYLNYLVTLDEKTLDKVRKGAKNETETQADDLNEFPIDSIGDRLKQIKDPAQAQGIRENLVERVFARPEFKEKTENFLEGFSRYIEPNPRSMKRLVTAFGIWRARDYLSGSNVDDDKLARWVIINQRWPIVENFLEQQPEVADGIASFNKERPEVADEIINGNIEKDLNTLLKGLNFPTDKEQIKTLVEHSTAPERKKILQLVKRITDRKYQNVSDLADSIKEYVRKEWDTMLMNAGVGNESIRKMFSNSTIISVLLGKGGTAVLDSGTVRDLASR